MINVFSPKITFKDIISVNRTLIKSEISGTSPIVKDFEKKFADLNNRKYGVAVSNGSTALDLALQVLDLNKNDEVIIPSFTIISCLSSVIRSGARPVFCDVDEMSWNMTIEDVKKVTTDKTKAVVVVHTYGLPSEIKKIKKFCQEKNIITIEDSAEAHGLKNEDVFCGELGDISTFSFYANKHITTGEGGILLTDNQEYYKKLLQMRNLDFKSNQRFKHENFYWNYRLSGLQAALGLSQLKNLSKTIGIKIQQGENYQSLLKNHEELLQLPLKQINDDLNHYWVFGVVLKISDIRDEVMDLMLKKGIETRPFFYPLHLQPALKDSSKSKPNLSVSEKIGMNGLYLPMGKHINYKLQNKIVEDLISTILSLK